MNKRNFWAVGYWSGNASQLNRFVQEKIWEEGYLSRGDKRYESLINQIQIGDVLLAKTSSTKGLNHNISFTRLVAIGIVASKVSNSVFSVEWKLLQNEIDFDGISYRSTIEMMREDVMKDYAIKELNKIIESRNMEQYKRLLESNHNLILTGAPGTGKTYLAKEIAKEMGCSDEEIGFVQFHPSYDYTDFVEGLRPIQDDNGTVGFERRDGVFKEFCKKALKNLNDSNNPNDSQNDRDFGAAYEKLLEDVSNGDITQYKTKGADLPVYVNEKGLLEYKQKNTTRKKTTSKFYLKILFDKFQSTNPGEILELTRDKMEDAIADSNCGIKTIDYIQYRWALSKIVSNLGSNDEHSKVSSVEKKSFVFIIDEINRGEISKIFGELFFSIDPGYRGIDENGKPKGLVKTQYQNLIDEDDEFYGGFYIPDNVYIIGTMNDIDRSVESMDFAFRRRFAFKEIKADENVGMLDNLESSVKDKAINRMKNLNNAISQIEGLSSAYHIGGSYFLKLKNYDNNFDNLWDYHIEGLLREYLRGNSEIEKHILELKTAYQNDKKDVTSENNG